MKICGITCPGDAVAAVNAGVDAKRLNFAPESSRCIELSAAQSVLDVIPDEIMTVGVFLHHGVDEILNITTALRLDAAQLSW